METTIKRLIALIMIFLMSFSVITCVSSNDFTVSAASAKTISIKKKPTVKASKIKATTVKLSWSKTKGATQYRVYKSTDKKKWTLVIKTKKTSYTVKNLKGNKKYYFKVRAYKNKTKSPYSKVITVKTKKNETVYATKNVHIRKRATSNSKSIKVLKKGKSIKRIGYAKNGWSKVLLNGKTAYIVSSYLTTKKPVEETTTKKQETTTSKKEEATTNKPIETTKEESTTKHLGVKTGETVVIDGKERELYIKENGNKYYYDENGVRKIYDDTASGVTGESNNKCEVCGKTTCMNRLSSWYCKVCKKTISNGECHPREHYRKSK